MSHRGPLPWDSMLSSSDILIFLLTCSVSLSSSLCFLNTTDTVPLAATKPVTLDLVDANLFLLLYFTSCQAVWCHSSKHHQTCIVAVQHSHNGEIDMRFCTHFILFYFILFYFCNL